MLERCKKVFDYDPLTGLIRRVDGCPYASKDWTAGTQNGQGYLSVRLDGKQPRVHHIAWAITYGYWPERIDHKDGNRANNRIANLRLASAAENNLNVTLRSNNRSGFKGVHQVVNGWQAQISVNKVKHYLGVFNNAREAAHAYNKAAVLYHGAFARLNLL